MYGSEFKGAQAGAHLHRLRGLLAEGVAFSQKLAQVEMWRGRRWVVLTQQFLLSFKEQQAYHSPTEAVPLQAITSLAKCDQ